MLGQETDRPPDNQRVSPSKQHRFDEPFDQILNLLNRSKLSLPVLLGKFFPFEKNEGDQMNQQVHLIQGSTCVPKLA